MKELSPFNFIKQITYGWNLGNYLDSHNMDIKTKQTINKSVKDIVALWGNPIFNFECLDELKNKGTNCLRIPVTWGNFVSYNNGKYTISEEVFAHLQLIVDQALARNFIVIIDMHHDDKNWLMINSTNEEFNEIKTEFAQIWAEIATKFKDYNKNLVFEGMNEIINIENGKEFWYNENPLFFSRLTELYNLFIATVRKTGGKNKTRFLIISSYGAQIYKSALEGLSYNDDGKIILDVHFYTKTDQTNYYQEVFAPLVEKIINKNIPLIIGECGNASECKGNIKNLKAYMSYIKKLGLKCILWDNGSSRKFIDRQSGKIIQSEFLDYCKQLFCNN